MRSSGNTPSPSRKRGIPLYLWVAGDDHPKACTGRRLLRAGLVVPVESRRMRLPGLLLDPHAETPLSPVDRRQAANGLAAVDCSWNRLGARGGYPPGPLDGVPERLRRRLPWLLAGNPQHYGRLGELNTAEALAAALVVLGASAQARELIGAVGAGSSFFDLNRDLLQAYAEVGGPPGIRSVEQDYFGD